MLFNSPEYLLETLILKSITRIYDDCLLPLYEYYTMHKKSGSEENTLKISNICLKKLVHSYAIEFTTIGWIAIRR